MVTSPMILDELVPMVLARLAELFADPSHWTQGYYYRAANGEPVAGYDPRCVCWCLAGGIRTVTAQICHAQPDMTPLRYRALEDMLFERFADLIGACTVPGYSRVSFVISWNDGDGRTHAEVLALIARAQQAARTV
jgi:hypothetical protein